MASGKFDISRHDLLARSPAHQTVEENAGAYKREQLYRSILEITPQAVIIVDETGTIETFSLSASRLFGYASADAIGKNVRILMPLADHSREDGFLSLFRPMGEKRVARKARIVVGRREDGSCFSMELTVGEVTDGGRLLFVGFVSDISECQHDLQQLQADFLHVSRLSAMGQMTAALAHELNQPLGAIANYVSAARRTLADDDLPDRIVLVQDLIEKATHQTFRAGTIIKNLRSFLRKHEVGRALESLNKVVEDAVELSFIGAAESNVTLHLNLDPTLRPIMIANVQIQQVLINLIRNSIEAMAEMPKRELTISTGPEGDQFVQVTVSDTGPGLSKDIAGRLFQHFVTTKNKGMGIGLTICQSIVNDHGGHIWTLPDVSEGAAFRIRLPITDHVEMAA
jgi:two-component system sensor kinase FixL